MMCIVKMSKKIHEWCHCQCTWSFQTQLKQVCQFGSFPKYKKNALKLTAKAHGKQASSQKEISSSKQRFSGVNCKLAVS